MGRNRAFPYRRAIAAMEPMAKRPALRAREFRPQRRVQDFDEHASEVRPVPHAIPVSNASRIHLPDRLRSVEECPTAHRVAAAQRAVEIGRADLQSLTRILTREPPLTLSFHPQAERPTRRLFRRYVLHESRVRP